MYPGLNGKKMRKYNLSFTYLSTLIDQFQVIYTVQDAEQNCAAVKMQVRDMAIRDIFFIQNTIHWFVDPTNF